MFVRAAVAGVLPDIQEESAAAVRTDFRAAFFFAFGIFSGR